MSGFRLTPAAAADLDAIYEHIALNYIPAAGRLLHRFTEAFHRITQMPGIGHLREDLTEASLRFCSVGSYLVIYLADREPLTILRVLHGSRDIAVILEEEWFFPPEADA